MKLPLALLAATCFPLSMADASSVGAGRTNPSDMIGGPGDFQGTINVGVYDRSGGAGMDTFGTGFATLDTYLPSGFTGDYLYLYQVSNSGPSPKPMFRSTVDLLPGASILDIFYTPLVFTDVDGPVSATNDLVGAATYSQDDTFDSTTDVGLAVDGGTGHVPTFLTLDPFTFGAIFLGTLAPGAHTTIFGYTSDAPPTETNAGVTDGVTGNGTTLSPSVTTPEPGALAGLFSLVPLLGLLWYRRSNTNR